MSGFYTVTIEFHERHETPEEAVNEAFRKIRADPTFDVMQSDIYGEPTVNGFHKNVTAKVI